MREKYGKFRGHYVWDLAIKWFTTPNEVFFECYGFHFNPHEYGGLYISARNALENITRDKRKM